MRSPEAACEGLRDKLGPLLVAVGFTQQWIRSCELQPPWVVPMHLDYIHKGFPAPILDLHLSFPSCISAETCPMLFLLSSYLPSLNGGFSRREATLARSLTRVTGESDPRASIDIWDTDWVPQQTTIGAYLREHNETSLSLSCSCCTHKSTGILRFYQGCTWEASFMESSQEEPQAV